MNVHWPFFSIDNCYYRRMYPELALFRRPLVIGISFWEIQMGTCLPSSRRSRRVYAEVVRTARRESLSSKWCIQKFLIHLKCLLLWLKFQAMCVVHSGGYM